MENHLEAIVNVLKWMLILGIFHFAYEFIRDIYLYVRYKEE